ncbi:MAG: hypothetical protein QOF73_3549 [Thermomicrobiales bacterium]|nr:hypothetical protein [Thermomicrobiales bacterium]
MSDRSQQQPDQQANRHREPVLTVDAAFEKAQATLTGGIASAPGRPLGDPSLNRTGDARRAQTILSLQRTVGNSVVQRRLRPAHSPLLPGGSALVQRCACGGMAGPEGECAACHAQRLWLQRTALDVALSPTTPSIGRRTTAQPSIQREDDDEVVEDDASTADVAAEEAPVVEEAPESEGAGPEAAPEAAPESEEAVPEDDPGVSVSTTEEEPEADESSEASSAEEGPTEEATGGEESVEGVAGEEEPAEGAPGEEEAAEGDEEAREDGATAGLIVEDGTPEPKPEQLTKSAFISQTRSAVDSTIAGSVAGGEAHGKVETIAGSAASRDAASLERSIRAEVPAAQGATSAAGYIPPITAKVREAVLAQASGAVSGALQSGVGALRSVVGGVANILFKGRDGGARGGADPQAVQAQLRGGEPLDGRLRGGMEAAFGQSFSQVRIHRDATAASLASGLNARAFTIGRDIAFGPGEYRPGTLVGAALIAHELAHVAQQGSSSAVAGVQRDGDHHEAALEEDADVSAVHAVASMWSGAADVAAIARTAMPALRSGLRLQRCSNAQCPDGFCWQVADAIPGFGGLCSCQWKCGRQPGGGPALRGPGGGFPPNVPDDHINGPGSLTQMSNQPRGAAACGCFKIDVTGRGAVCDPPASTVPSTDPRGIAVGAPLLGAAPFQPPVTTDPKPVPGIIAPGNAPPGLPPGVVGPAGAGGGGGGGPVFPGTPVPMVPTPPIIPLTGGGGPTPAGAGPTPAAGGAGPGPAPGPTPAGAGPIPAGPGPTPGPAPVAFGPAPGNAVQAADFAAANGGAAQPGFRGGGAFANDGRGGGQVLPTTDAGGNPITYREYDVNPFTPGVNRGRERIVIGGGAAYYTNNHYITFTKFR